MKSLWGIAGKSLESDGGAGGGCQGPEGGGWATNIVSTMG
jgi:hypothetical protein